MKKVSLYLFTFLKDFKFCSNHSPFFTIQNRKSFLPYHFHNDAGKTRFISFLQLDLHFPTTLLYIPLHGEGIDNDILENALSKAIK